MIPDVLPLIEAEHAQRAEARQIAQREVDLRNEANCLIGGKPEPTPHDPMIELLWLAALEIKSLRMKEAEFIRVLRSRSTES